MLKKYSLAALVGANLLFSGCSLQQSENHTHHTNKNLADVDLNLKINKKVLSNGLTILHLENKKLPIVSVYTFFDVGGKSETPGVTGSTHFLEHMMFKKTKNFPAEHFSKVIENNGGNSNAYTTFDNTVYYENIPVDSLDEILHLEAERLSNLELEEEPFEKERQVVLEERKMRYENKAGGQLFLRMMKEIFVGTPYGGSVIGDASDVKNLSREKMLEFYHKFYRPNNAVLVVVGDVEADKLFKMVEEKYGAIPRGEGLEELQKEFSSPERFKHRAKLPKTVSLHGESVTPMFMMAFPSLKAGEEDGYALDILSKIIGSGDSSYLSKEFVISKKPKLSSISAANYSLKESGVFYIGGSLLDKVSLNSFKNSLMREVRHICDKAVTERSVQKTKNNILIELYSGLETNDGLAGFIGNQQFYYGDYNGYKRELEIYSSLTADKVKETCKKYIDGNKSLFISVWKKHRK
ncbi:pitrilysin family protein [Bacteriovorax sp. Seq25_V]|uniref:M16 family metallopeptidase n=1 Tax=Bacteriovorax sp. Seq25_V TaxID=1201288 RepID=UPI00038A1086|nr:pitrilysin family protein [Bacteriovorax sp. Seq25_V]EQC46246.1 peptidase, M16 family [Bacteriovorax sp. Seq25_V]